MNSLKAIAYDPATAATLATTATTVMTAVDTTNLRATAVVPAHGEVRVRMQCVIEGATTFPQILLGVLVGANVKGRVSPLVTLGGTALATTRATAWADFTITGLAAGSTNFDAAIGVETAVASSSVRWGGPNDTTADNAYGAFVLEILDPMPITNSLGTGPGFVGNSATAGVVLASVQQWNGSNVSAAAPGIPDVNVKNINNVAAATPGASGGILISGSNSGTTTLGALTVTGATTLTGNMVLSDGLTISAPSTLNRAGITITGNGTGAAISGTGGATGQGILLAGGGTSGEGIKITTTSGDGLSIAPTVGHGINTAGNGTSKHGLRAVGGATSSDGIRAQGGGTGNGITATSGTGATGDGILATTVSSNGNGFEAVGVGTGAGLKLTAGATGPGATIAGGASSGDGIDITTTAGDGISSKPTAGHALVLTANGTSKHGAAITGGTAGTSDGINVAAGTGGTDIRAANITGTLATVTTLTNLPAIPANWLTAAGIAAAALNGKGDWLLAASYTAPLNLTASQIATGIWGDTTPGDFTVAGSIGQSVMNGVALGVGLTINDITTKTGYSLSASGLSAVLLSDLVAVPAANAQMVDGLSFLFMGLRNLRTTAAVDTVNNNAGIAIGTAALSDDGTTFTKGKYA